MLQSMGSQKVRHDWATEQQQQELYSFYGWYIYMKCIHVYIYVCIYTHRKISNIYLAFFTGSSVNGHLLVSTFWLLGIMLSTFVHKHLFESLFWNLLGIHQEAELLGHMVILSSIFWGNANICRVLYNWCWSWIYNWYWNITNSIDMSLSNSRRWWRTEEPGVLQSMGVAESDMT